MEASNDNIFYNIRKTTFFLTSKVLLLSFLFSQVFSLSGQDRIWRYMQTASNTPSPIASTELELDSLGNLYQLKNGKKIFKYDHLTGSLLLSYDLIGDSTITSTGVHVDSIGYTVVAGSQMNRSGNSDMVVAKFDSSGLKLWHQVVNGFSNVEDFANAFEVDQSGNIYVLATVNNTSSANANSDVVAYKYSPNGTLVWSSTFNGALNGKDLGKDLAINSNGEVFITGSTQDYNTYGTSCSCNIRTSKAFLIKYDSLGVQSWIQKSSTGIIGSYPPPSSGNIQYNDDVGYQVEVEGNELFYVRDIFAGGTSNPFDWDYTLQVAFTTQVIKLNFNGSILNTYNYTRPSGSSNLSHTEIVKELKVNPSGESYIKVEFPTQNSRGLELVKLNTSLGVIFSKDYDNTFIFDQISFDFDGDDTYLANSRTIYTSNTAGIVVYKFDNTGTQVSAKGFLGANHVSQDLMIDNSGDIYIASGGVLMDLSKLCGSVPTIQTILDTTICFGDSVQLLSSSDATSFSWNNGSSLSSDTILSPIASPQFSQNYTVTASFANGCSSTSTVRVEVPSETFQLTLCNNDSMVIRGKTYKQSGVYYDTIVNAIGCDSIIILDVITGRDSSYSASATICQGDSLFFGGNYVKNSGIYKDTLTSMTNCDSIIELTITNAPSYAVRDTINLCQGDSVMIHGIYRMTAGSYQDTYQTSLGCDSIYTTTLFVDPNLQSTQTVTACGSYLWLQNGQSYSTSVQVSDTVLSSNGCDSILILDLTINSGLTADAGISAAICNGGAVSLGGSPTGPVGSTYSWSNAATLSSSTIANPIASPLTTTVYQVTVSDINGCTSVDSVTLTVNPLPVADAGISSSICNGGSVHLGGSPTGPAGSTFRWSNTTTLSDSTISNPVASPVSTTVYRVTVTDVNGCTNIDNTTLSVNPLPDANAGPNTTICNGQSVIIGGSPTSTTVGATYLWSNGSSLSNSAVANPTANPSVTTVYTVTITSFNGCTSMSSTTVAVSNTYPTSSTSVSSCGSYTWAQNGQFYTVSGSYNDTVATSVGCDSIYTLNLTINSVDTSISQSGFTLTVAETGAQYQWLDCTQLVTTPIVGATNQSYTVSNNGKYSVEVTTGNCVDTSSCVIVLGVGISELEEQEVIKIYPNPSNNFIMVEYDGFIQNRTMKIYGVNGELVDEHILLSRRFKIDVSELSKGVYFISIGNEYQKLIVN